MGLCSVARLGLRTVSRTDRPTAARTDYRWDASEHLVSGGLWAVSEHTLIIISLGNPRYRRIPSLPCRTVSGQGMRWSSRSGLPEIRRPGPRSALEKSG